MKKYKIVNQIDKTLSILLGVSFVLTAYTVTKTNLIPQKYLLAGLVLAGLLVLFVCIVGFRLNKPSKIKRISYIIGVCLLIAANVYASIAAQNITNFIQSLQSENYTYEEYSVIAKKDRHITLVSNQTHTVGLIENNPNEKLVLVETEKLFSPVPQNFASMTSILLALDGHEPDTAIVKSPYVQLLQENAADQYDTIEVLATFKVRIPVAKSSEPVNLQKPFVVYISGIDTYGDVASVARSDVNMLAVVNPQTHKILLVNTPRDYYVQLHGTTGARDKLTHAGIYGIDMSVKTLEDLYDTPINYYLRVNFTSLVNTIDVLGDIDVYSDYDFASGNDSFKKGYNTLNSEQALAFSRTRYAFADGDRTRGKNQQRVIEAIITKMSTPSTLVNYRYILASLRGSLQTDMGTNDITKLIMNQLDNMSKWSVESISVNGTDSHNITYSMGNISLYVMEPDIASVNEAKQKMLQYR